MDLKSFLLKQDYTKIKLHLTKTNHFEIIAKINGVKGRFIVDTGASNSCVGLDAFESFKLKGKASDVKAAGAGSSEMETMMSVAQTVSIGGWKQQKVALILFNLVHVNTALTAHDANPVHGIIGADLLKKGKAIIDYDKKYLYLKL